MGRLESLTALALGRGSFEDEIIAASRDESSSAAQQYGVTGRPQNPETKRRERDHVRAANEVMQVTGIVEDTTAAKIKADASILDKNEETLSGLRLMEVGRGVLVGGTWGVLGLRRRVLLYKPYSEISLSGILGRELSEHSVVHLFFAGIPAVITYHALEWAGFFAATLLEAIFEEEEEVDKTKSQLQLKGIIQSCLDIGLTWTTTHLRMFAILQQLNIVSGSRFFPSLRSFFPFSEASPLWVLPPPPLSLKPGPLGLWGASVLRAAAPVLMIWTYRGIEFTISRLIYRPIYKTLPRPTGESMFSGLSISAPALEYDAPDRDRTPQDIGPYRGEDEPTLRALEGLPAIDRTDTRSRRPEAERGSQADDEESEITPTTLISFDVEQTENLESAVGTWSAELRSANEAYGTEGVKYKVTGVTMLPPIMATEGLRDLVTGVICMPVEAFMIRVIARAYRASQNAEMNDHWPVMMAGGEVSLFNLFAVVKIQLAITGLVWVGYCVGAQWWAAKRRSHRQSKR